MTDAANRKYFVDVFNGWISDVRKIYDPTLLLKPYSYFGSITDVVNYLTINEQANQPLYPFVCLIDDFEEKHNLRDAFYSVDPTIYIFSESLVEYNPQQRYDNVIKPILYTIMDILLSTINFDSSTSQANETLIYTKKTYKGQVAGQSIQDTVDCIELKFSNLLIKNKC